MLLLRRPTSETIWAFLDVQNQHAVTFPQGATFTTPPAGYDLDHARVKLGEGEKVFRAARSALERWQHFRLGWTEAAPEDTPIKEGKAIAVLGRSMGLWSLNACRIIAVVDEEGPVKRFGFTYGTLPDHVESGAERFLVEWDTQEGSVWYDILAFSRPRHILARVGYLWIRHMQKLFREHSAAAMCRAVQPKEPRTKSL